jgi:hypothetical protein
MSDTPALGLPQLAAEQAQKHVTMNEALGILDAVVQLAAKDRDLAAPPGAPAEGDRYIVATSPTGDWAGQAGKIAVYQNAGWTFLTPREGWLAWIDDENVVLGFTGAAWTNLSTLISALQNLTLLGVGTAADATNPFSAKLNKALWTAKTAAEGGDGDLRYTMTKEAAADVLSLLLQTGFSGRAEIGLIGDDNLTFKVSADGSAWTTALVVNKTTGALLTTAGSAAAPAVAIGEASSGWYHSAAGVVGLSLGGVSRATWGADNLAIENLATSCTFITHGLSGGFIANAYGANGTNRFNRHNGTKAVPTDLVTNDNIGQLLWAGYGGGALRTAARIYAVITETTPSGTAMGTRFVFQAAPTGSVTLNDLMFVDHAGGLSMFGANPVIDQNRHLRLRSYTIATLPAASAAAGQMIYCSDLGGGGGQVVSDGTSWRRASRSGQQAVAPDAAFTLTTLTSAERQRHTGTLTANRLVTLSTTNAYSGSRFHVTRTGAGAFNLEIGGLKNLAQNTWCEVVYDGAAWYLAAYGAL